MKQGLADAAGAESRARALVESLALCAEASLMLRYSDRKAADAFCDARLGSNARSFGTLDVGAGASAIVDRALPA